MAALALNELCDGVAGKRFSGLLKKSGNPHHRVCKLVAAKLVAATLVIGWREALLFALMPNPMPA